MVIGGGRPAQIPIPQHVKQQIDAYSAAGGAPIERNLAPDSQLFEPPLGRYGKPEYSNLGQLKEWVQLFQDCIVARKLPKFLHAQELNQSRFIANLIACQQKVTVEDLKRYLKNQKRINVEQVAGLVMSLLGPETAATLVPSLRHIILRACMWILPSDVSSGKSIQDDVYERLIGKLNSIFRRKFNAAPIELGQHEQLYQFLLRIRRRSGKAPASLRIPFWLCEKTSRDATDPWHAGTALDARKFQWPQRSATADVLVVGRHQFSVLERLLFRFNGKQDDASILRRAVESLWVDAISGGSAEILQKSTDALAIAFSFVALQRKIQQTVVSDAGWTTFLEKGESKSVSQNAKLLSSFELSLAQLALARPHSEIDFEALCAVVVPPGLEVYSTSKLKYSVWGMDQACLLMEDFVRVHGGGKFSALTFQKGVKGDCRGPVDQYNLLVDCLAVFQKLYIGINGSAEGTPEACHKFLAKDIMVRSKPVVFGDAYLANGLALEQRLEGRRVCIRHVPWLGSIFESQKSQGFPSGNIKSRFVKNEQRRSCYAAFRVRFQTSRSPERVSGAEGRCVPLRFSLLVVKLLLQS